MPQETLRYVSECGLSGEADLSIFSSVLKAAGDNAEGDVVKELGGLLNNPKAKAYVSTVGQKLVSGSQRQGAYTFDIIKNKQVNAFALPNGSVYVTEGLLRMLRTEAQLANVMGHEVGHVDRDHGMKQFGMDFVAQAGGALAQLFAGGDSEARKKAKEMATSVISNGYSQELENQADEIGQKFAYMAGWDPQGMIDIMTIFVSLEKGPKLTGIEAYTRSHPYAEDRLALAKQRVASAYTKGGDSGADRYKAFLADAFSVSPNEAALSPAQAAVKGTFMVSSGGGDGGVLVPALAIGGVAVLVLVAVYLYLKE